MNRFKLIGIAVGILLILGGGFWYSKSRNSEFASDWLPVSVPGKTSDVLGTSDVEEGATTDQPVYQNYQYGFSFRHPEGFKITEFAEEWGDVVLIQGNGKEVEPPMGGSTSQSFEFQIFITPFDEEGPMTLERVKKDLPNIEISKSQNIEVSGASMLIFFSQDPSLGKTREAWFVWPPDPHPNGNYLYQITSAAEFDEELSKIMATWKFQ